jgi:hypothetical protein
MISDSLFFFRYLIGVRQKFFSLLSYGNALLGAQKNGDSQIVLQFLYQHADMRLSSVQLFCGSAERSASFYRDNASELL